MPQPSAVYTYRSGRKVLLDKRPDQFVVRALPEELEALGMRRVEKVSSRSTRVTTDPANLEPLMAKARTLAPTHHAYTVHGTGEEFLVTDRILVTFRQDMRAEDVDAFAARYALV